jgi:N6-L-threonylcarbamoyladenine synthase
LTILLKKLKKAALDTGIKQLCIAGGVSANSGLRKGLQQLCDENGWEAYIPKFEFCTDNAAMIALTAWYKLKGQQLSDLSVSASARATWQQ